MTSKNKSEEAASSFAARVGTVSDVFSDSLYKWQLGDWTDLATLDLSTLEKSKNRAELALLVAAAQSHVGSLDAARMNLSQALNWGAGYDLTTRVMISAAQNSLGCAAMALRDKNAPAHFFHAIRIMQDDKDSPLMARIRQACETSRLGVRPAPPTIKRPSKYDRVPSSAPLPLHCSRPHYELPYVIVIAGVPRSGSTWLYNAVRLICETAKLDIYACWVADYTPDEHSICDVHLVKLHNAKDLNFPHHHVLTTQRDLDERLASLLRMGWIDPTPEAILKAAKGHQMIDSYWRERTDFETSYENIRNAPANAVAQIARCLSVPLRAADRDYIAKSLTELKEPTNKANSLDHDQKTLMHPKHRASEAERSEALEKVRSVRANVQLEEPAGHEIKNASSTSSLP